jgi:hypothetical protein
MQDGAGGYYSTSVNQVMDEIMNMDYGEQADERPEYVLSDTFGSFADTAT